MKGKARALEIGRSLQLVWESARGLTLATAAIVLFQSAIPPASLYLLKRIVDAAGRLVGGTSPEKISGALYLVAIAAGVAIIGALLQALSAVVEEAHSQRASDYVQDVLHRKSIDIDLAYYESSAYYDRLHRAQEEAPHRPQLILKALLKTVRSCTFLASIGALLLLSLNWVFVAALFGASVPIVALRMKQARRFFAWRQKKTSAERAIWYLNWVLTGGLYAKEIRSYGLGELFAGRSRDLRRELHRERVRFTGQRSIIDFASHSTQTLIVFAAVAFLVFRAASHTVTIGDLVMLYQALQRGRGYLQELLGGLSDLVENSLFLTNLYEFLRLEPRILVPPRARPLPRPLTEGVAFEEVEFRHAGGSKKVLDRVSFTLRPGAITALIGSNGAGKTTAVRLLCRLYDPTGGRITLDGVDLREFALDALRRELCVLFQDFGSYHMPAWENVWLGNVDEAPDPQAIRRACEISGADEFVRELPHGYETLLGTWFDQGEELSTGQWKKLALARALYRDGQIVLLDEPLTALDGDSEVRFLARLRELADAGKIVLVTSHRMSITRVADTVLLLENGRVTESGAHEVLIEAGGRYARLYDQQTQILRFGGTR